MSKTVLRVCVVILSVAGLFPTGARAATLTLSSDTVQRQHQDPGTICVSLVTRGGEQVAGTENLLLWDGECASILAATCAANPGHGKNLSGTEQRQRDFTYKALILSLTDTDPIPPGELYCCDFLVHARPGECCRVRIGSPGASDPAGNALSIGAGPPGQLCVADDGSSPNSGRSDDVFAGGGFVGGTGGGGGGAPTGGSGGSTGGGAPSGGTGAPAGGGPANTFGGSAPANPPGAVVADLGAGTREVPEAPAAAEPARPQANRAAPAAPRPARQEQEAAAPVAPEPRSRPPAEGAAPDAAAEKPPAAGAAAQKQPGAAGAVEKQPSAATAPAAKEKAPPPADAKSGTEQATAPDQPAAEQPARAEAPARSTGDLGKPSPRDVRRSGSGSERRMPLDNDDGWFGCQIGAPVDAGRATFLLLPALLLLLGRGRRRI
jgi:hypothetical protein